MADYISFNKVILIGRISSEIKSRDTKRGTPVAWFNVATNEVYGQDKKPHAFFHRVICFGKKAQFIFKYGEIGRLIAVEGKIHTRSWGDESGARRSMTEVSAEQVIVLTASKGKQVEVPEEQQPQEEEGSLEETEGQPADDEEPFG